MLYIEGQAQALRCSHMSKHAHHSMYCAEGAYTQREEEGITMLMCTPVNHHQLLLAQAITFVPRAIPANTTLG